MPDKPALPAVGECMKAVAYTLDMPVTDISEYLIVAVRHNGTTRATSNGHCEVCAIHLAARFIASFTGRTDEQDGIDIVP